MRTEPDVDPQRLLAVLRSRYQLDVERLDFVPLGIDSWSYVAALRDGGRCFLKLVRALPVRSMAPGSELPMVAALASLDRVHVARPIADRDDRLMQTFDGFALCLLEYLDGHALADEETWPDDLYGRVADAVAAIHASTSEVRSLVPGTERFELPFLASLVGTLAIHGAGGPLPDDLRVMLTPAVRELHRGIERLEELRDFARSVHTDEVLCHTDIWGSNLLLSGAGVLHVLDWSGAMIGPLEADLFMFAGTSFFPAGRFGWFLDRYEAAFRRVHLDADVLGFYLYRRNLEDLASFVEAVAEGNSEAMDRRETLGYVAALLAELPRLEEQIRRIRRVLQGRPSAARA